MRFNLSHLCVALAFGGLALGVNAQPAGNAAPGTAPAAQSATGSSGATANHGKRAATKQQATKHRSTTHAKRQARSDSRRQMASESNGADSAYKAALRRCVTGPESSRDACLDRAISQYGHA